MGRGGQQIGIVDPTALSELLALVIARSHRGSANAAAKASGLGQSFLSRLMTRKLTRITGSNYQKLRQFVGPAAYAKLEMCFVLPATRSLLRSYQTWLKREIEEYLPARNRQASTENRTEEVLAGLMGRRRWRTNLTRLIQTHHSDLSQRLERALQHYGHTPYRGRLAWQRVLQPLLDAEDAFGIERQWDELAAAGELRAVLAHGVAREVVLLKRLPDERRAQRVTTKRGMRVGLLQNWAMWER